MWMKLLLARSVAKDRVSSQAMSVSSTTKARRNTRGVTVEYVNI